jgi:hypothetical protein
MIQRILPVSVAAVMMLTGCGPSANRGTHYQFFVDGSGSINKMQRAHWGAKLLAFSDQFQQGDAVTIRRIHANTASAEAVYEKDSPVVADGAPYDEVGSAQEKFSQMVAGYRARVENMLSEASASPDTDLFSVVDRVQVTGDRVPVVIIVSDMLHSTKGTDFEKLVLGDQTIGEVIQATAREHRWANTQLAGVRVVCLLPSLDGRPVRQANNRQTLKRFWETLFRTLGARLERFDTEL